MGRKKIKIEKIQEGRNRQVTYLKRKAGLFKKAYELATLTDSQVAVIVFGHNGRLSQFCSGDMDQVLLKYTEFEGNIESKGPDDFVGSKDDDDEEDDGGGDDADRRGPQSGAGGSGSSGNNGSGGSGPAPGGSSGGSGYFGGPYGQPGNGPGSSLGGAGGSGDSAGWNGGMKRKSPLLDREGSYAMVKSESFGQLPVPADEPALTDLTAPVVDKKTVKAAVLQRRGRALKGSPGAQAGSAGPTTASSLSAEPNSAVLSTVSPVDMPQQFSQPPNGPNAAALATMHGAPIASSSSMMRPVTAGSVGGGMFGNAYPPTMSAPVPNQYSHQAQFGGHPPDPHRHHHQANPSWPNVGPMAGHGRRNSLSQPPEASFPTLLRPTTADGHLERTPVDHLIALGHVAPSPHGQDAFNQAHGLGAAMHPSGSSDPRMPSSALYPGTSMPVSRVASTSSEVSHFGPTGLPNSSSAMASIMSRPVETYASLAKSSSVPKEAASLSMSRPGTDGYSSAGLSSSGDTPLLAPSLGSNATSSETSLNEMLAASLLPGEATLAQPHSNAQNMQMKQHALQQQQIQQQNAMALHAQAMGGFAGPGPLDHAPSGHFQPPMGQMGQHHFAGGHGMPLGHGLDVSPPAPGFVMTGPNE